MVHDAVLKVYRSVGQGVNEAPAACCVLLPAGVVFGLKDALQVANRKHPVGFAEHTQARHHKGQYPEHCTLQGGPRDAGTFLQQNNHM